MTVPMAAERARDRLDRGLQALARAGDDPAILAYALNAVQGALEAHYRSVLASDSRVPAGVRVVALDTAALSVLDVANAMHAHLDLPERERRAVLEAHGHCQSQSQGDGFTWDRAGVEEYARYVAQKLGEPAPMLNQPVADVSSAPTSILPEVSDNHTRWTEGAAGLAATRPYRTVSALARRAELKGSHFLLILSALAVVSLLWNWVESAAFDAASRAAEAPTLLPTPTTGQTVPAVAVSSPVAAPAQSSPEPGQSATVTVLNELLIVGNTDGEGVFVRRTPSLADRLEPFEDGTRMRVIGPDREAEGRRWKHVRAENGLVGWVPAQYLIAANGR